MSHLCIKLNSIINFDAEHRGIKPPDNYRDRLSPCDKKIKTLQ